MALLLGALENITVLEMGGALEKEASILKCAGFDTIRIPDKTADPCCTLEVLFDSLNGACIACYSTRFGMWSPTAWQRSPSLFKALNSFA
jgi:hypothetical protein